MTDGPARAARRAGSGTGRLIRAWRTLPHESRLAAYSSLALILTLFLPWYQVTLIAPGKTARLLSASATITGWGAFSFVEAAVLLIAAAVLTLLFQRAEGRAFHVPGGDGGVITAAGLWTCVLIVWRIFDKQGATTNGVAATSSGVEWGIFLALAAGASLAYSGSRIRAAHRPEPPLPGEDHAPAGSNAAATADGATTVVRPPRRDATAPPRPRRRARMPTPVPADQAPPAPAPTDRPRRAPASRGAPASRSAPPRPGAPARPGSPSRPATPATPHGTPDSPPAPPDDRPRRRASAAELFERVVPEDPPTMRISRRKPPDEDPTRSMAPARPDEQTTPLGEDPTLPLRDDATLRLDKRPKRP